GGTPKKTLKFFANLTHKDCPNSISAGVAELADAHDSKSCERKLMSVRPRPPAYLRIWCERKRSRLQFRSSHAIIHSQALVKPGSIESLPSTRQSDARLCAVSDFREVDDPSRGGQAKFEIGGLKKAKYYSPR